MRISVQEMDVTAENFSALLPVIKQQIEGAAFIAIDEEMTGIQDRLSKISADDSPSQRYLKMVSMSSCTIYCTAVYCSVL